MTHPNLNSLFTCPAGDNPEMSLDESAGASVGDLDTPCLIVDIGRFERNIRHACDFAHTAGKRLRPHAKTHKCSLIARKQLEAGAIGLCAAKPSEAEALVRAGIRGVLITGPVSTPLKAERLMAVRALDPSLIAVVESVEGIRLLEEAAVRRGLTFDALVDIDAGQGRTGALPGDVPALAARIATSSALRLRGVQAYAGHTQHIESRDERRKTSSRR